MFVLSSKKIIIFVINALLFYTLGRGQKLQKVL